MMNRLTKTAIAVFILSVFLLSNGNTPTVTPAAAETLWSDTLYEGTTYKYRVTNLETASGATEALMAIGGGPNIQANSTASSLGGHYIPVGRVASPSWANIGDWRNVIPVAEGYTFEVTVDTISPEEEATFPKGELITPLIKTYNEYGVGAVTNYFPTNPYSQTTVFMVANYKALVFDEDHDEVEVPVGDEEYQTMLDFKLTEPLILPTNQYEDGNATFYQAGDPIGERSSWIPVGLFNDIGYWRLEYRAATPSATPLGAPDTFYEVALLGHDIETGICLSYEITNRAMLAWMSDPADPVVAFKFEWFETELPEEDEDDEEDSPGFELGVVLFSLAAVATIVAYRKRK
jgi:hypothetical protein